MNNRVILLIALLVAWIGIGLWLCNKYFCNASPSESISQSSLAPAAAATTAGLWNYDDGNKFSESSMTRYIYGLNGANHINAGNEELINNENAISGYLKGNPDRELEIVGHYKDNEKNNSLMPTLGHARADVVKDRLMALGIPAKQLTINGALLPEANKWSNAKEVTHGIDFNFSAASADARLSEIKNRLFGKPLTVYFKTGENQISFSADQRKDFNDMLYYMENVSESKLNIGGHTDSAGGRRANIALSQKRAEFVADYLTTNAGVKADRMAKEGFGPNNPIATNDTSEGKAKNRRVEIILN